MHTTLSSFMHTTFTCHVHALRSAIGESPVPRLHSQMYGNVIRNLACESCNVMLTWILLIAMHMLNLDMTLFVACWWHGNEQVVVWQWTRTGNQQVLQKAFREIIIHLTLSGFPSMQVPEIPCHHLKALLHLSLPFPPACYKPMCIQAMHGRCNPGPRYIA